MKLPLKSTALAVSAFALLGAAGAAQAAEYANVVSATPVTGSFPVPRQQCAEGTQVVPAQPSGGGALVGAIIGGVIGNQIGHGAGRAVATGIGAVAGAGIGNHAEIVNSPGQVVPVRDCRTVSSYESRVIGYDVVYEYHGQRYTTRTAAIPGRAWRSTSAPPAARPTTTAPRAAARRCRPPATASRRTSRRRRPATAGCRRRRATTAPRRRRSMRPPPRTTRARRLLLRPAAAYYAPPVVSIGFRSGYGWRTATATGAEPVALRKAGSTGSTAALTLLPRARCARPPCCRRGNRASAARPAPCRAATGNTASTFAAGGAQPGSTGTSSPRRSSSLHR